MEDAFRMMTNGVYVVTTRLKDRTNGMTAAWVTRVSFSPPLIVVSIGRERFSHDLIKESGFFAINILREGQEGLGRHFGLRSGRHVDKFSGMDYFTLRTGSPILPDTAGYLECKLFSLYEAGDHTLFVGEVIDGASFSGARPLLFRREDYFGQ